MRVIFGLFLEGSFVLVVMLVALFVVLLQYFGGTLSCRAGGIRTEIKPNAGFERRERVKRPAFLPGT